jgi:heterodisulfide reductase subunit A-like polyferredoxin
MGIRFVRCRVHTVVPGSRPADPDVLVYADEASGALMPMTERFDMVVLSVGMEIGGPDLVEFAARMGIELDQDNGFCRTERCFAPTATSRDGVMSAVPSRGPRTSPSP